MAKKTTAEEGATPKATRNRKPQFYLATVQGDEKPKLIKARNFKIALNAIVKISVATGEDLFDAGKNEYLVIDTTTAKEDPQ